MARDSRGKQLYSLGDLPKGSRLSPSKKVKGALSPLIHGKKGLEGQVVLIPEKRAGKSRSGSGFRQSLASFAAKSAMWIFGSLAVLWLAATLIAALVEGIASGVTEARQAIASVAGYLIAGAVGVALIGVAFVVVRNSLTRRQHQRMSSGVSQSSVVVYQASPVSPAARTAQAPAGWYTSATNAAQFAYWDGTRWTGHTMPQQPRPPVAAGWYLDPVNQDLQRYWDGGAWTNHTAPGHHPTTAPANPNPPPAIPVATQAHAVPAVTPSVTDGPRLAMTSDEWQSRVRAYLAAKAISDELLVMITQAHIEDADPAVAHWQSELARLSPEQLTARVTLMLEANPSLRDELPLTEFMRLLTTLRPVVTRREQIPLENPS